MWQMSGLGPMHGQAHDFVRYCPAPSDDPLHRYRNEAVRLLHVLEHRLAQTEYLAEDYSIADIACWPWVRAARAIELDIAEFPSIRRWYKAIDARDAVRRGAELKMSEASLAGNPQLHEHERSNRLGGTLHVPMPRRVASPRNAP